jgi:superfamily I DNA and RNA helicase
LLANRLSSKGYEAAVVFACGIDAVPAQTRSGRNKLFTAFTRTKAWLRVSGIGSPSEEFSREMRTALDCFPHMEFTILRLATLVR